MLLSFNRPSIFDKLSHIESDINTVLSSSARISAPGLPAREVSVLDPQFHPAKKGLSFPEGRARLLHDLASIELQAMELGLRTLAEFPEAPAGFKEELAGVTLSEASHLRMCIEALEAEGFRWGDFPVHTQLWQATGPEDTLLDRILIVHRYLEGSGLDAGDQFRKRLGGVATSLLNKVVLQIHQEEIGHVEFGSRWYREVCRTENRDPASDFVQRMNQVIGKVPKRVEKINHEIRKQAGFTPGEIDYLENLRMWFLIPLEERKNQSFSDFYQIKSPTLDSNIF